VPTNAPRVCDYCHRVCLGKCQHKPRCKLYNLRDWRDRLRAEQLYRQPLCEDCLAAGRTTAATQVHHKVPHQGNLTLFLDADNLMSLCASCHSIRTAHEKAPV